MHGNQNSSNGAHGGNFDQLDGPSLCNGQWIRIVNRFVTGSGHATILIWDVHVVQCAWREGWKAQGAPGLHSALQRRTCTCRHACPPYAFQRRGAGWYARGMYVCAICVCACIPIGNPAIAVGGSRPGLAQIQLKYETPEFPMRGDYARRQYQPRRGDARRQRDAGNTPDLTK